MITIKDFIEDEQKKMTWLDKVVRNYPRIHQTSFLNNPLKQSVEEIVIRPSIVQKLPVIPFIFFALLFLFYPVKILINNSLPALIPIGMIFFILFILYMAIWHTFFNPKYIYSIRINHQFIEARHQKYNWENIADTCIMFKMSGRIDNVYLVILMKDGNVEKLNLSKFSISAKKVSGIVEYYKIAK
jgi:hypothetical protein